MDVMDFFQDNMSLIDNNKLTIPKEILLDLARESIKTYLVTGKKADFSNLVKVYPEISASYGSFVTVCIDGLLRGCVGKLEGEKPIYQDIIDNAIDAAFNDIRFPPVKAEELDTLHLEISILGKLNRLEYKNENYLLKKLAKEKVGVVLIYMGKKATLLPQVWEKVSDPKQFLAELTMKAGFTNDVWKEEDCRLLTYQAYIIKDCQSP